MKLRNLAYICALGACVGAVAAGPEDNVIEEAVWTIGDQPIWRSDVESSWAEMRQEKYPIIGDPYCFVPEQIALDRIYLHQADLDSIEANPSFIAAQVDARLNDWISAAGSREQLELYLHKTLPEIRQFLTENTTNNYRISEVQKKLVNKVKPTPAQVRRYFDRLPMDSIPFVPTQVEVEVITLHPYIARQEIDDIKERLRGYAERVNNGTSEFSTLAIMYSEDGSSTMGGEIGFMPRARLAPEYAATAFNLTDPKKASAVVETEYGFHIIQLIEKRGDRVNTRHILMRPKPEQKDIDAARVRLDSIRADILADKFTFEQAAGVLSQDKDTRNNHGLMTNPNTGTSMFAMSELPAEVARAVADLKPGQVSQAFAMKSANGTDVVSIAKLKSRTEAHRANIANDYQLIRNMAIAAERERILKQWVDKKIASTHIRIEPGWRDCPNWRHDWLGAEK
ncbi:MAG: peptidylprolyl isomerase [Muribaculaceae bacterium]|nr:peptidylprolyl isomerase [Bacteroidales bacterium]MBD5325538.1 peptidylprolyl isomerase [Bacteroides sp.]MDE6222961.1 peptidylprolyl isomerase [Muribaculaceae bacterium]MBD5327085.1 peptidylprolyl isomerase [Bacteroides sp.]MBD5415567.1 peptidylprolyl isomerase [Bacteroides sp.]